MCRSSTGGLTRTSSFRTSASSRAPQSSQRPPRSTQRDIESSLGTRGGFMEQATVSPETTGASSKTIADLLPAAVGKHGPKAAIRFKDDSGKWVTRSYDELGETVRELALGLMDLGIQKGDKVAILANTRP